MPTVIALALACADDSAGGGTETGTTAPPPTDTTPAEPPPPDGNGLLQRVGTATVGVDYVGVEDLQLLGEDGYGAPVCVVRYDLTSTAARSDCPACDWAFDLLLSNAAITVDVDGACAAVGVEPAALEGTTVTRGFNPDYAGHASVLMIHDETGWQSASYAEYDASSGAFAYEWDDGFVAY